jgi:hypothetical protein
MSNKIDKQIYWQIFTPLSAVIGTGLLLHFIHKRLFAVRPTGKELAEKASIT